MRFFSSFVFLLLLSPFGLSAAETRSKQEEQVSTDNWEFIDWGVSYYNSDTRTNCWYFVYRNTATGDFDEKEFGSGCVT